MPHTIRKRDSICPFPSSLPFLILFALIISGTAIRPVGTLDRSIKASPTADCRYSTTDIAEEPRAKDYYDYNFAHMGLGGSDAATSSVWYDYRGETTGETPEPVTVAVIDSGIDIYHEEFLKEEAHGRTITEANIASYSLLDTNSVCLRLNGSQIIQTTGIVNVYDAGTVTSNGIRQSHGTAVASCIAAAVNGVGGFGIAPKARLMIIKTDGYRVEEINAGIKYAADHGADIINMSFTLYKTQLNDKMTNYYEHADTVFQAAIDYAAAKNIILVAAAGNENTTSKAYPASNTGVIGVGALEERSGIQKAKQSNYNTRTATADDDQNVDLVAPGCVYAAAPVERTSPNMPPDNAYVKMKGTSFAAPLAAGAIALYKAKYPSASKADIINALTASCDDIGSSDWDEYFGHGRVNVNDYLDNDIPVDQIIISKNEMTLTMTEDEPCPTGELSVGFQPTSASRADKKGIWRTEDENVCKVDATSGVVTAVNGGRTTVTFTTRLAKKTASCTVTVDGTRGKQVNNLTITSTGSTTLTMTRENPEPALQLELTFDPVDAGRYYKDGFWGVEEGESCTVEEETGLVTGIKCGTTKITYITYADMIEDSIEITVDGTKGQPVTKVTVTAEGWGNEDPILAMTVADPSPTVQMIATFLPADAGIYYKRGCWIADDPSTGAICEIDENGLVTAKGPGTTTIYYMTEADGVIGKRNITINDERTVLLQSITLKDTPSTVPFMGTLDTSGITVTATYSDNTSRTVTGVTYSSLDTTSIGEKTVTASYMEGGITKTAAFNVFVTNVGATRTEQSGPGMTDKATISSTNKFGSATEGTIDGTASGITWTLSSTYTGSGVGYTWTGGNNSHDQFGSRNGGYATTVTIASDSFLGSTITSVKVKVGSHKDGCKVSLAVNDVPFLSNGQEKIAVTLDTSKELTFTGEQSGRIELRYTEIKNNVMFFWIEVTTKGGTTYSWTGDQQASSYVTYLKKYRSCAADWNDDRTIAPRLVREYNAMKDDAKASAILTEPFEDYGYQTTPLAKLIMIVTQYNDTLQPGETELVLDPGTAGETLIDTSKRKTERRYLEANIVTTIMIGVVMSMLGLAFTKITTLRKENEDHEA